MNTRQISFNQFFEQNILPIVRYGYEEDGVPDKPARREHYNNYLDYAYRSGEVTENEVNEWIML
jgi:hypothetical protein